MVRPSMLNDLGDRIYLNLYSLLLLAFAVLAAFAPLWAVSRLFLFLQIPAALWLCAQSFRLFSTYPEKKRMVAILLGRNRDEFRPASFAPYMKAPCSRLVVRRVLRILGQSPRYGELLSYRPSLTVSCRESRRPTPTRIYYGDSDK